MNSISYITYNALTTTWANFIRFHEIGFFIWPPKSSPSRRIVQFLNDENQQNAVGIDTKKNILVHIHFYDALNIPKERVYEILQFGIRSVLAEKNIALTEKHPELILKNLEEKGYDVTLFITGIDSILSKVQLEPIKDLIYLYLNYRNISILFFTGVYINIPPYTTELLNKHTSNTNIFYKCLYTLEDSKQFLEFMLTYWNMSISDMQRQWILEQCAGKLGLIKTALRIIRNTSEVTADQLSENPLLIERSLQALRSLPSQAQSIVEQLIHNRYMPNPDDSGMLDYLKKIGYVGEENNTLAVFPKFYRNLDFALNSESKSAAEFRVILSRQERRVFSRLQLHLNTIINREELAEAIWGKEWEDKYSEWAIDKLVQRLRDKILQSRLPFKIMTKRKQGFMMITS